MAWGAEGDYYTHSHRFEKPSLDPTGSYQAGVRLLGP